MAIYTSSNNACNGAFTEVPAVGQTDGCGDDECVSEALQARIETALTGGTTYFILIWEFDATAPTAGNTAVQLCINQLLPPTNDTCATPTTLLLDTPQAGSTFGAFNDYQLSGATCFTGISQTASTASSVDVVYQFTAPVAGNYSFTVSNYNTESNLVLFACDHLPGRHAGDARDRGDLFGWR